MNKIEYYGTLGPGCAREDILVSMFEAGMTGIRLNLSHKSLEESRKWVDLYQKAAKKCGKKGELLIDLMGPEIRIGNMDVPMDLKEGEKALLGKDGIEIPYYIEETLEVGQTILLDDGKIELVVLENNVEKNRRRHTISCSVIRGGILKSRKSLAVPGVTFHNPTLTKEDLKNLEDAKKYDVTAVMLPFVRGKEDLICLQHALKECGSEDIRI